MKDASGVATPGPVRACALVVFFLDPPCFNYNYVYSLYIIIINVIIIFKMLD